MAASTTGIPDQSGLRGGCVRASAHGSPGFGTRKHAWPLRTVPTRLPGQRPLSYLSSFDRFLSQFDGRTGMGRLTVGALRAVLVMVLAGTAFLQALMVWALVSGSDPQGASLPLATLRELGFGGEVAGLYRRYRHACPEPAIDILAAFGLSAPDLDADAEPGGACR